MEFYGFCGGSRGSVLVFDFWSPPFRVGVFLTKNYFWRVAVR